VCALSLDSQSVRRGFSGAAAHLVSFAAFFQRPTAEFSVEDPRQPQVLELGAFEGCGASQFGRDTPLGHSAPMRSRLTRLAHATLVND